MIARRTCLPLLLVGVCLVSFVSAQQPNSTAASLTVNGLNGPAWPIDAGSVPGSNATVLLTGSPGGLRPFALGVGRVVPGITTFAGGFVDVDLVGCGSWIPFNGFDPTNPAFAFSNLGPAASPSFTLSFGYPATANFPAGGQAAVADPTNPAGVTLSAAVDFFPGGPQLASIAPNQGPQGGGNLVTLTGNGFLCFPATVLFGFSAAANVSVVDANTITCVAPPSVSPGTVDVTLSQGGQTVTLPQAYTYVPGNPISTTFEGFDTQASRDGGFAPTFADARWNGAGAVSQLTGTPISGSALASFNGNPGNLGSRVQVNMPIGAGTTLPLTTVPFSGLFSPFDSALTNLGPGVNPNGGSRIMHLVEAQDLGNPRASLELIEWGPTNNTVVAASYPNLRAWCGMTTVSAPIVCQVGVPGMAYTYQANYDLATPQDPDPTHLNPLNPQVGGVRAINGQTYATAASFTSYYPFPVFDTAFDYIGSGVGSGNLILEQDISPHAQPINLNRFRATAFTPTRRLIGASGAATAFAGGCDIYDLRFTFVQVVSSAQSTFYDTGITAGTPTYLALGLNPDPSTQPAGTQTRIEVEGATALLSPTQPMGTTSGWLTYLSGTPSNVVTDPTVLFNGTPSSQQLSGHRYFRFRATLRANHQSNALPAYDDLTVIATF